MLIMCHGTVIGRLLSSPDRRLVEVLRHNKLAVSLAVSFQRNIESLLALCYCTFKYTEMIREICVTKKYFISNFYMHGFLYAFL